MMISFEAIPFINQTNDLRGNCMSKLYQSNCSNGTQTHPIEIAQTEESKVALLEKSIEFLRTQHEEMLKALHSEIEHLRKLNKALQFRLVMCCCAPSSEVMKEEKNLTSPACNLHSQGSPAVDKSKESDINTLRQLLEEERRKTSMLQKQLESRKLAHTAIMDSSKMIQKENSRNARDTDKSKPQEGTRPSTEEAKYVPSQKSLQSTGSKPVEQVSVTKIDKTSNSAPSKQTGGSRIISPDLNPDSSSSAILLSPNTVMDTPDGFWVRPSVATLTNPAGRLSLSPRATRTSGHLMPVKLPVLRSPDSLNQVTVRDTTKDVLSSKLHPANEDVPGAPEGETPSKKFSNQSNEARYSRSSRSVRNIIRMYETARSSGYPTTRSHNIFSGYSNNNNNPQHEPFLPAITRAADSVNSKMKKARDTSKKHSYRNSDHGHP